MHAPGAICWRPNSAMQKPLQCARARTLRDGYLLELAMPGVDFACPFPASQLSVLKRLRRLDLSNSRISGKCAPGPAAPRAVSVCHWCSEEASAGFAKGSCVMRCSWASRDAHVCHTRNLPCCRE